MYRSNRHILFAVLLAGAALAMMASAASSATTDPPVILDGLATTTDTSPMAAVAARMDAHALQSVRLHDRATSRLAMTATRITLSQSSELAPADTNHAQPNSTPEANRNQPAHTEARHRC